MYVPCTAFTQESKPLVKIFSYNKMQETSKDSPQEVSHKEIGDIKILRI